VPDFEETYGSSVNARMAAHMGEGPPDPVDDVGRQGMPGDPPVPGAQWDELHERWEQWDESAQAWVIVGGTGDGVATEDENPVPSLLARELLHADELDSEHVPVPDVARAAEPDHGPPGAQWNEIEGRWDRWDEAAAAWVPVDPA
jgi:hypothetical protein